MFLAVGSTRSCVIDLPTRTHAKIIFFSLTIFAGIDEVPWRGDCESALEHPVPNIGEWVKSAGKGLGIVSTAALTDATPAAVYAHSADREWQSRAPSPCLDIATQLVCIAVTLANVANDCDVGMKTMPRCF